jgi:type III restriction enzyme
MSLFNQQDTYQRLDKRIASKIEDGDLEVVLSPIIKNNLKFGSRQYQTEAFTALDYYLHNPKLRAKPTQVLFHMATGSGKTLVMAGAILELYNMGYRNFIFFVNTDTIIRKTKENFLNPKSSKYLFKDTININGVNILINEVQSFESTNDDDISILFSTIQGLHTRLNNPRENSITFDDFRDKKVVLISDEAHHINALTKKTFTASEKEVNNNWENTVDRIFRSNVDNIMMEFTATLELSHPNIAAKYADKLLYDYPLTKFREDKYSKEVKTNQVDFEPIDRAVVAVVISQYKKKVFSANGIIAKPVIMFKSKTTAESAVMEEKFIAAIKTLNTDKLQKIVKLDNEVVKEAIAYFSENKISLENLIDELREDFSADKVISVNSKNDSDDKQITINSLEDFDNEYRAIFAVDKLNEGWDVLNLFDIVRLYDTRDAKGNNPGKTTVQEAQLIGRGARYFPFKLNEDQELDKRKYDDDITNQLRVCETLHYHCSHNPRYITELNQALRQIGLFPDEKVEVDLFLKDEFKETSLYKNGFILLNKKVLNTPKLNFEYQEPDIVKRYTYSLRTNRSAVNTIFDDKGLKANRVAANYMQQHRLNVWDKTILIKGLNKNPFYRFDNIKRLFPSVKSIMDFATSEKYLGGIIVDVTGLEKDVKDLAPSQKLEIVIYVTSKIANEVTTKFGDYRGTKSFYREPIRKHFRNKKLTFSISQGADAETGKPTMRHDINEKYFVDLNKADWYAFNENYGSSEEKFLVKFFQGQIKELKEKFFDIYLLRNERHFKLFRFSDGKATEPDFVLFMKEKQTNEEVLYQLFIEPKGNHLLYTDQWKEDLLLNLEQEAKVELYQNQSYRLVGMPFYNKENRESVFEERLNNI